MTNERALAGLLLLALAACGPAGPAAVNEARIERADREPGNWMTHGRTCREALYVRVPIIDAHDYDTMAQQIAQGNLLRRQAFLMVVLPEVRKGMLTALTLRFELMNQRESLADTWRDIKFKGDDLKSVLNLNARQRLRARSDVNRPFDFAFDDSDTRVLLSFDAPLNRRAQRNSFRQSLIDYNAGLRTLMEKEDTVKFQVRDSLRRLALDQEQYRIYVASAAFVPLFLECGVRGHNSLRE